MHNKACLKYLLFINSIFISGKLTKNVRITFVILIWLFVAEDNVLITIIYKLLIIKNDLLDNLPFFFFMYGPFVLAVSLYGSS